LNPVSALGVLPSIQGFQPLPFAAANEFMSLQGGNMALYFGAYFQIGKRYVSSLSNEAFNRMMAQPKEMIDLLQPQSDALVQNFIDQLDKRAQEIQTIILDHAHELELKKVEYNVDLLTKIPVEYIRLLTENQTEGYADMFGDLVSQLTKYFEDISRGLPGGREDPPTQDPDKEPEPPVPTSRPRPPVGLQMTVGEIQFYNYVKGETATATIQKMTFGQIRGQFLAHMQNSNLEHIPALSRQTEKAIAEAIRNKFLIISKIEPYTAGYDLNEEL
jgi:hypothetical protein